MSVSFFYNACRWYLDTDFIRNNRPAERMKDQQRKAMFASIGGGRGGRGARAPLYERRGPTMNLYSSGSDGRHSREPMTPWQSGRVVDNTPPAGWHWDRGSLVSGPPVAGTISPPWAVGVQAPDQIRGNNPTYLGPKQIAGAADNRPLRIMSEQEAWFKHQEDRNKELQARYDRDVAAREAKRQMEIHAQNERERIAREWHNYMQRSTHGMAYEGRDEWVRATDGRPVYDANLGTHVPLENLSPYKGYAANV